MKKYTQTLAISLMLTAFGCSEADDSTDNTDKEDSSILHLTDRAPTSQLSFDCEETEPCQVDFVIDITAEARRNRTKANKVAAALTLDTDPIQERIVRLDAAGEFHAELSAVFEPNETVTLTMEKLSSDLKVVSLSVKFSKKLAPPAEPLTEAIMVSGPASGSNHPYQTATVSAELDPSRLNWIAWNDTPEVALRRDSRPDELFLGPGSIGTNGYIRLTVQAPSGAQKTLNIDEITAYGVPTGTANVIFGNADDAPDVFRQNPDFATPPNKEHFLNESGSHHDFFRETGTYEFTFDFEWVWGNSGTHGPIYLLINRTGGE